MKLESFDQVAARRVEEIASGNFTAANVTEANAASVAASIVLAAMEAVCYSWPYQDKLFMAAGEWVADLRKGSIRFQYPSSEDMRRRALTFRDTQNRLGATVVCETADFCLSQRPVIIYSESRLCSFGQGVFLASLMRFRKEAEYITVQIIQEDDRVQEIPVRGF